MADDTTVTMVPAAAVEGGAGIPPSPVNQPFSFKLMRGQHAQISQATAPTASVVESDKPVGFIAGQQCLFAPDGVYFCDHAEQMVPPVKALGSGYVGCSTGRE